MNNNWLSISQEKDSTKVVPHSQFLSLVYHDMFDYPLSKGELKYWQVGDQDDPVHKVSSLVSFYFLKGREEIVFKRKIAHRESLRKYRIAKKAAKVLSFFPSIQLIGLSGSLSMGNAKNTSDIDFFVVVSRRTLWVTRLLGTILLRAHGFFINSGAKKIEDGISLDQWVDFDNLGFGDKSDIFTAHKIVQTKVLFDRSGVYRKFLNSNRWIKQFFPNAYNKCLQYSRQHTNFKPGAANSLVRLFVFVLYPLDVLARLIQLMIFSNLDKVELGTGKLIFKTNTAEGVSRMFISRLEALVLGLQPKQKQEYID